jgi:uncharacterized GH25 family protein
MAGHARTLAILGGVLAACVAATAWLALSDGGGESDGGAHGAAANGESAAGPAADRPKRLGSATVFGEIRRSAGKRPVAGQEVRLAPQTGDGWTATTDAQGAFRFEQVPHGGPYELSAAAPSCGTIRIPGIALDRNEKRNLGTLWLDPSVKVTVRVRDGADAPVAGARVEAFAFAQSDEPDWSKALAQIAQAPVAVRKAVTGEDGEVQFAESAVGTWTFAASKEGFATGGAEVVLRSDEEPRPVTIRLGRGHPLDGRVIDSAGKPLANALVIAGDNDSAGSPALAPMRARTKSADDGRYAFAALPSGNVTLWVARAGGTASPAATLLIPRVAHYDLVVPAEGTLRGTVTEKATRRPVEGAVVRATSWESDRAYGSETATDAEGRYELRMAAGAVNELTAEKEGLVQAREAPGGGENRAAVLQEGAVVVRDITMERGARLTGIVRGNGAPLASAHVLLHVGTPDEGFTQKPAITDENGRYEYAAAPKGTFLLLAVKEGWYLPGAPEQWWEAANERGKAPEFEVEIPGEGEAVRDLEMRRGADVTGTVQGPDGAPLAGARVRATGADESAPSGADGAFRLEGVTPGASTLLTCRCEGFTTGPATPIAVDADRGAAGVVIKMLAVPHVRGTVTLRSGGVPTDVRVLAAVESGDTDENPWVAAWRWTNAMPVPVRAGGAFDGEFSPEYGGRLLVRAESDAYAPAESKPIPIVAGQEAYEVQLVVEPGAALTGRVTTKSGDPLPGADVSVAEHYESGDDSYSSSNTVPPVWAVTGEDGTFEIPHLAAGRYDVHAAARGFVPALQVASPGEGAPVTIALSPELTIEGTVALADGRPVEGLEVQASTDEEVPAFGGFHGETPSAVTDARGAFRVSGLTEGPWDLAVSVPWGAPINVRGKTVTGVAAGTRGLKVVVEEGGRIRGRVVDTKLRPVAGVALNAGPTDDASKDETGDEGDDGGWHYATSKDDGSFEFLGLGRGPFEINADPQGSGHRQAHAGVVAVGSDDVEIVVEEGLAISGVLVGGDRPLANVGLWVNWAGPRRSTAESTESARTDSQGRFTISGLAPGAYRVDIAPWGGQEQGWLIESHEPVQAGAQDVRVVAVRGATIAGTVVDEAGRPLAGAAVIATMDRGGRQVTVRSKPDGTFELAGLAKDAKFTVRATMSGRAEGRADEIPAGATSVRLVLASGLSASGRIVRADGKPAVRAMVLLTSADGRSTVNARTDAAGRFSAGGLADGAYAVRVYVENSAGDSEWKACGTIRGGDANAELREQE